MRYLTEEDFYAKNEALLTEAGWKDVPKKEPDLSKCGTSAGYYRHQTAGTPVCQECRLAKRAYDREYEAERRKYGGRPRKQAKCGTVGGYHKHWRLKQDTCQACKDAVAEAHKARQARKEMSD